MISLLCLNAHAIYDQLLLQNLIEGEKLLHSEFKRKIAEQLCKEKKVMEATNAQSIIPKPELIVESDTPLINHHTSKISGTTFRPSFYVRTMYNCEHNTRKSKPRINMVCLIFKIAFHPTCFPAYHNPDTVTNMDVRVFF